ncbi:MAG: penicillin-binding protein activator LpoB [Sphaerochaetaceae bacterium]|nr:penicillin-binding protein activator LpoB [Sphaerochaetaceae bacterium]
MRKAIFCLCMALLVMVSCASYPTVERLESEEVVDLTGNWNDTDVSIVCSSLLNECLSSANLEAFRLVNNRNPVMTIGSFKNQSSEHLDTSIITTKMRNEMIKSGKVEFIATRDAKQETRAEIIDQMEFAKQEQQKSYAHEDAADFMMQGAVKSIVQEVGKKQLRVYYVSAELIDIESGKIVWTGENSEIKKYIKKGYKY